MGCSSCKSSSGSSNSLPNRIANYIERDDFSNLEVMFKAYSSELKTDISTTINKPIIQVNKYMINALGYSLILGKPSVFNYLLNKMQASLSLMDSLFQSLGISPLYILCENGYIEILQMFLPYYLNNIKETTGKIEKSTTLSFSNSRAPMESSIHNSSPIQVACLNGHISIIHYINEFFKNTYAPMLLDVHHIDEITGENCALISVRTGNFPMIKLLFEGAEADFHIKNNNNEGALQILAAATKSNLTLQFLECVMYLVDVVGVDVSYMHEETLLLLENKLIIKYIEEKLKGLGIQATKRELESIYRIRAYKRTENPEEKSNIVGDTQELSNILPESHPSTFNHSVKF